MKSIAKPSLPIGVLLLAFTAWTSASAQCDRCRIPILSIPVGVQAIGLGGAYVTGDGPDAVYHNPAQAGSARGTSLGFERLGEASLVQLATTGVTGRFSFGTSIRFLTRRDNPAPEDSASLRAGGLTGGLSLATQVRGVWVGGTAKFVSPDLGADDGGVGFDVGVAVRRFGLLLGLAAQDLGRDVTAAGVRQQMPTRVSLGASWPSNSISTYFDVGASAQLTWERGGKLVPAGGVELTYEPVSGWMFTGRAGAHRRIDRPGELQQSAFALGASFGRNSLSLDYAFQPAVAGGHPVHAFGIRVQ